MTNHDRMLIETTVRETLRQIRDEVPAARRKATARAPAKLVAWLAGRERVTLAEVLPVLGLSPGKRGASLAGFAVSAAGWHRVGRTNGPEGQVWHYERRAA